MVDLFTFLAQLLKGEPGRELCAVECQLIKEATVAEVIVKIPVAHLRKHVTGDLATECAVSLHSDVGSDSESANIAFRGEKKALFR